ncbi:hypothetical protein HG531_012606 [Fusarium graminearum]|nr:hypothetical protein HG531_012606 [Fusarium graminearum]
MAVFKLLLALTAAAKSLVDLRGHAELLELGEISGCKDGCRGELGDAVNLGLLLLEGLLGSLVRSDICFCLLLLWCGVAAIVRVNLPLVIFVFLLLFVSSSVLRKTHSETLLLLFILLPLLQKIQTLNAAGLLFTELALSLDTSLHVDGGLLTTVSLLQKLSTNLSINLFVTALVLEIFSFLVSTEEEANSANDDLFVIAEACLLHDIDGLRIGPELSLPHLTSELDSPDSSGRISVGGDEVIENGLNDLLEKSLTQSLARRRYQDREKGEEPSFLRSSRANQGAERHGAV